MFPHGDLHPTKEVLDLFCLSGKVIARLFLEAMQTVRHQIFLKGADQVKLFENGVLTSQFPESSVHRALIVTSASRRP